MELISEFCIWLAIRIYVFPIWLLMKTKYCWHLFLAYPMLSVITFFNNELGIRFRIWVAEQIEHDK